MDYKLDEADRYELRNRIAWLQYRLASSSMNLCSDGLGLTHHNMDYFEKIFQDLEDLKSIVKVIKNRKKTQDISTCFDETEAA